MSMFSGHIQILSRYSIENPIGAARNLEGLREDEAVEVLLSLSPEAAGKVFPCVEPSFAAELVKIIPSERFGGMLQKLDSQRALAVFYHLPAESRAEFFESLPDALKKEMEDLLRYPEDSAGRIMKPDYLAFSSDMSVENAVEKIRQLAKKQIPASYVYVIDSEHHLLGVINMRDLMLADPSVPLYQVMRKDVFTIDAFMDREHIAEELGKRRFFSAPVVDAQKRLVGIIRAESLLLDVQEEATEDMQKMFGAGADERAFSPVSFSLKTRLPWLHVNLLTAFMAAAVVAFFEDIIARLTVLAVFLPVVAGQGGNAGAQSLAVVMRAIVMREIPKGKITRLIAKETFIGAVNGIVIGVVTGLVAWWWNGNPYLGVVIGLGMLVNLALAGFSGAAIPIAMKKMGLDPAQCSNIILTTVTDVMGFFAFLGFAVIFEKQLL